jgi:hypothetical protein
MKTFLKNNLSRYSPYILIDLLRDLPSIYRWLFSGCSFNAPSSLKRLILLHYLKAYRLNTFCETGTFLGDTLACVATNSNIRCLSIELSSMYFQLAQRRFLFYPNISLFLGDSSSILPVLLPTLTHPTLFWLDGHYSGDHTARADVDTPILNELKELFQFPNHHVILIDDARLFNGESGYPCLHDILKFISNNSSYSVEVSTDVIRLTPTLL